MNITQTDNTSPETRTLETYQMLGRILGPGIFVLMLVFTQWQTVMPALAWKTAAVSLWMAIWWATEAIPVAVTAFLPIVLFEPLGIASLKDAAAPFANPIIYLFLGGFIMALAVERWNLHRRISLAILQRTGTDGKRLIGGFMLTCALLSMWMTNTSTTMMLLPIVLSVVVVIHENISDLSEERKNNFQIALLLGLAYSASIGGLATLVGTPPNALLIGYLAENYAIKISFARWMLVGVPVTLIMLPLAWWLLTHYLFPVNIPANESVKKHLQELRIELGPMTGPEKRVAVICSIVILLWIVRRPLTQVTGLTGLSDAGIVMAAAVFLFFLPSGNKNKPQLMTWNDAARVPWGILILFGGGLSLAAAVSSSGLALWLGESLAPLSAWGTAVLVIASVALVIFLTELTSNLATTASLLPVMGAIALQAGLPPLLLTVPIAFAASCAFMLPVATPPNAIVFATEKISIPQMMKAGFLLNLLGMLIISIIALYVAPELLA